MGGHMAITELSAALEDIVAKQAIGQAIASVQRGIDRSDLALLKSAFHDDADVAYGFFDGSAVDFCDIMAGGPPDPGSITMHRPANVWIKVDGDRAISESYVFVYSPGAGTQGLIGGRYLDRHERRDGQWRLSHRTYVLDWNINQPATGSGIVGFEVPYKRGQKGAEDPGVRLLAQWGINDKPADIALEDFYREWQEVHSKLSFDLHPTRDSYVRNSIARALTAEAPAYLGIVLERFPSLDDFTDDALYFGDPAVLKEMVEHLPSFYAFESAITGGMSEFRFA
jgi:hypothetical protein